MYNPQLETFIKVADCGSFNKAAEQLYISPPAVVKQINLLESSLDVQLFSRTHRGIALTDAGKSLYQDAKYIIQYCQDSVRRAKNAMQNEKIIIRIGTSPMTPENMIMDMWYEVRKICPDMKFQLIPFENTTQNAREILCNLGQNIDIVAGMYDSDSLKKWKCSAFHLKDMPIRCAVSVYNELADKSVLNISDLYDRNFMLIRRNWNSCLDRMRDDLYENYPQIHIIDFDFFSMNVFNQCENSNDLMMCIDNWTNVHPMLKVIPVDWNYTIPFGILHSPKPSSSVRKFLNIVKRIVENQEYKL